MPTNPELSSRPATRSDVAGLAIKLSVGLFAIANALRAVRDQNRAEATKEIDEIVATAMKLSETFDDLTGYVP
jgi:hypothetical protein